MSKIGKFSKSLLEKQFVTLANVSLGLFDGKVCSCCKETTLNSRYNFYVKSNKFNFFKFDNIMAFLPVCTANGCLSNPLLRNLAYDGHIYITDSAQNKVYRADYELVINHFKNQVGKKSTCKRLITIFTPYGGEQKVEYLVRISPEMVPTFTEDPQPYLTGEIVLNPTKASKFSYHKIKMNDYIPPKPKEKVVVFNVYKEVKIK